MTDTKHIASIPVSDRLFNWLYDPKHSKENSTRARELLEQLPGAQK